MFLIQFVCLYLCVSLYGSMCEQNADHNARPIFDERLLPALDVIPIEIGNFRSKVKVIVIFETSFYSYFSIEFPPHILNPITVNQCKISNILYIDLKIKIIDQMSLTSFCFLWTLLAFFFFFRYMELRRDSDTDIEPIFGIGEQFNFIVLTSNSGPQPSTTGLFLVYRVQ